MTTAVDSAVLLDVFQEEPGWAARSADALDAASSASADLAAQPGSSWNTSISTAESTAVVTAVRRWQPGRGRASR